MVERNWETAVQQLVEETRNGSLHWRIPLGGVSDVPGRFQIETPVYVADLGSSPAFDKAVGIVGVTKSDPVYGDTSFAKLFSVKVVDASEPSYRVAFEWPRVGPQDELLNEVQFVESDVADVLEHLMDRREVGSTLTTSG